MFDLGALDILTPSEEGRDLVLRHPSTLEPWLDDSGKPITITMLGRHAGIAEQTADTIAARRAARSPNAPPPSIEDTRAENAEYLAAVTKRWRFTHLFGRDFPCTTENARLLYGDPRMAWVTEQALAFHRNDGHFLARPTLRPSNGPSAPSGSTPPPPAAEA